MENYIINKKTIALLKKQNKTIIYDVDNIRIINKSIEKIINENCNYYGSSLKGRKDSAKKHLNITYKVPIIINKNIILLQLNSIRNKDCLFLVFNKIIEYKYINNYLQIFFVNKIKFEWNISQNSFEKMLINGIKLNNYLINQKSINIV